MHSVIYIELPADFFLATTNEKEQLAGYAIFGRSGKSVTLYELAAVPQKRSQITRRLLQAIQTKSVELGAEKIDTVIPQQHPMRPDLVAMGFTPASRKIAKVTAGQIHDFGKVWRLLAGENPEIVLKIWTPSRTIELPGNGPSVSLEMKETKLQRLFMCRENFNDLYVAEWITSPTDLLPVETLQRIFRPVQWVFHYFDYI